MKAIIGGRGTGRTWSLLQEASKENGLVVCHSKGSAEYTKDKAIGMYKKGEIESVPEIVWVGEIIGDSGRDDRDISDKRLFIDNTELALQEIFNKQVGKFVVLEGDENTYKSKISFCGDIKPDIVKEIYNKFYRIDL